MVTIFVNICQAGSGVERRPARRQTMVSVTTDTRQGEILIKQTQPDGGDIAAKFHICWSGRERSSNISENNLELKWRNLLTFICWLWMMMLIQTRWSNIILWVLCHSEQIYQPVSQIKTHCCGQNKSNLIPGHIVTFFVALVIVRCYRGYALFLFRFSL